MGRNLSNLGQMASNEAGPTVLAEEERFPAHLLERIANASDGAETSRGIVDQHDGGAEQRAQEGGSKVPERIAECKMSNGEGMEGTGSEGVVSGQLGADKAWSGDPREEQSKENGG